MSERLQAIQKHTGDMLAVEEHILEAVERQRETDVVRAKEHANELLIKIERTLKKHVASLKTLNVEYNSDGESVLKKAVAEILGAAAGIYDKLREHTVSRMMRDNYTALSLVAMSYTMYHTFGLAIKEQKVADLAEQHLRAITPLLVEISKQLPVIVADEVAKENNFPVDTTVADQAVRTTQQAWEPEVTNVA